MKSWHVHADVRLGLRLAWKHGLMTLTVVAALAVGVALATAAFTFTDAVVRGRLPFADGDRFVRLEAYSRIDGGRATIDAERFGLLQEAASFDHLGAIAPESTNLRLGSGEVVSVNGARVTPGFFAHTPVAPLAGRLLDAADGRGGAEPVAILRESLWERHLGRDPAVVGSVLDVGGTRRTVVGIVPDDYRFPNSCEIWLPIADSGPASTRSGLLGGLFGVLRRGVSLGDAADEVRFLSARHDERLAAEEHLRLELVGFTDLSSFGIDQMLTAWTVMTLLVLVVIAANVANLVYARTAARAAELATRSALGATRRRIVVQLFTEVALLASVSSIAGLVISQRALRFVERSFDVDELPFWLDFTPRASTMAFVALAALVASLVAGALPALKATRRDLLASLRADGARGGGFGFGRVGGTLMVVEMALSVALVTSAVSLARGVARYGELESSLPDREVITAQVWLEPVAAGGAANAGESVAERRRRLVEALREIPGVQAAGAATALPRMSPTARPLSLEASTDETAITTLRAPVVGATEGFLESLGGSAVAGRLLEARDFAPGAVAVAVVNEPFVAGHLGGGNPIGRRIRIDGPEAAAASTVWREIVGVVPDLGLLVGDPRLAGGLYVPIADEGLSYLSARAEGDPLRLSEPLRRALYEVDPALEVRRVGRLDAVAMEDRVGLRLFSAALVGIGLVTLALALVGMYAIVSFAVTRRTREIGIRVALGASPRQVLGVIFGRALYLLAAGGAAGTVLATLLVALRGSIFASRLPPSEGWVFPAVLLLFVAAGLAACHFPARRALEVAPIRALNQE